MTETKRSLKASGCACLVISRSNLGFGVVIQIGSLAFIAPPEGILTILCLSSDPNFSSLITLRSLPCRLPYFRSFAASRPSGTYGTGPSAREGPQDVQLEPR